MSLYGWLWGARMPLGCFGSVKRCIHVSGSMVAEDHRCAASGRASVWKVRRIPPVGRRGRTLLDAAISIQANIFFVYPCEGAPSPASGVEDHACCNSKCHTAGLYFSSLHSQMRLCLKVMAALRCVA